MISKKKFFAIYILLLLGIVNIFSITANAADTTCDVYSGGNINSQNYYNYDNTIKSYLTSDGNGGLMRIQSDAVDDKILIEYYDTSYNIKSSKTINNELPIFGAFYETTANYYILSGQVNLDESDNVEVFRITKYDKNWKRISSCSLYGVNTYIPFDAGSARITTSGKYMLIRTAHEMYASGDGLHHQANVTIQVNMDNMTVTDYFTDVMNSSYGYVSHSFNQFIKTEGNNIIAIDHGDAYPRSIVLTKYNTDFTTGKFVPDYYDSCTVVDMMEFPGNIGQNYTGATIGGFEISNSSYIVAGNATEQTNNFYGDTRNIFVAVASRDTGNGIGTPTIKWITNYAEGVETTKTPHLIKLSGSKFILLWSQGAKVYYTQLDAAGNRVGSIYSFTGDLSDCVPYQSNGKIIWYTWNYETVTFYEISTSDISVNKKVVINNGHKFTTSSPTEGSNVAKQVCKTCGHTQDITVPISYDVWWGTPDSDWYYTAPNSSYYVNDTIKILINTSYSVDNNDMVVKVSDSSIATLDANTYSTSREIKIKNVGDFTITIYPRYNTKLKTTYNIKVTHKYEKLRVVKPTYTAKGYTEYQCEICKEKHKTDYVAKLTVGKVTNLSQSEPYSITKISMAWNKNSKATGYEVYRATSKGGTYTKIKTTTSTKFTDTKRKTGVTYYYKIRPYRTVDGKKVYGTYSAIKAMSTKPKTPSITLSTTKNKAKIAWKAIPNASGYEVYIYSSKEKAYKKIRTASSKETSFAKKGLTSKKKYYFKVRSYKLVDGKKIYSNYSSAKAITVK